MHPDHISQLESISFCCNGVKYIRLALCSFAHFNIFIIMNQKTIEITYKEIKDFSEKQLEELFLSVNWESAKYPSKLVRAMKNSSRVVSAWDGERLVGLARAIDDGETVALIHYVLVNPAYQGLHIGYELVSRLISAYKDLLYIKVMPSEKKNIAFYEKFGFKQYDNYSAMIIKHM